VHSERGGGGGWGGGGASRVSTVFLLRKLERHEDKIHLKKGKQHKLEKSRIEGGRKKKPNRNEGEKSTGSLFQSGRASLNVIRKDQKDLYRDKRHDHLNRGCHTNSGGGQKTLMGKRRRIDHSLMNESWVTGVH